MLLMVEKGIKSEICHAFHRYAEVVKSKWKSLIKIKNLCILSIAM